MRLVIVSGRQDFQHEAVRTIRAAAPHTELAERRPAQVHMVRAGTIDTVHVIRQQLRAVNDAASLRRRLVKHATSISQAALS